MKALNYGLAVLTAALGALAHASDEVLMIDRSVDRSVKLAFPNDANVRARRSEFELINYVLMSSESGERWAIVTLRNMSTGNRFFESEQLLALGADGSRYFPEPQKVSFAGGEVQSVTVQFGKRKFPVLDLQTAK